MGKDWNGFNNNYRNNNYSATPKKVYIVKEEDYVKHADEVMDDIIKNEQKDKLTTSKIRNILAMFSEIYNEVMFDSENEGLSNATKSRINYMTIRMAYECGRDKAVKFFNEKSDLIENIKKIGDDREKFILVFHYMEALVAYHRFYGGKDN